MTTNNISTCLWFDDQAEKAAKFYTSVFDNAEITTTSRYTKESSIPSGKNMAGVRINLELPGN
ncbi:MAG TPA: VOC family protein [Chitinophagaceae bacterium]|nr:VOC family protein [Chitinophagaceae bacterium]